MSKPRLMIVSTVPDTFKSVLKDQPQFLAEHFDVSILCGPPETPETAYDPKDVTPHVVKIKRAPDPFADLRSIWQVARVLRREKPDIVHSFSPKGGLVGMLASRLCRVPVRVHSFTGLIFPTATGMRRRMLEWVDRIIAGAATHVVPEGEGVRRDLSENKITRKSMPLIANGNIAGVDLAYFNPDAADLPEQAAAQRSEWGIPEDAFVFGFIGRLSHDKGMDELWQAFKALERPDAWLVCLGYLDPRAPLTPETHQAMTENPNVILAGFLHDIRPGLANFDAMVLPSYREGFPNVLLQASAMRVPLIATDVNGSNEIVVEGETGWLVPAQDADALHTVMAEAAQDGPDLAAMGEAGRRRIETRYGQEMYREALLAFYHARLAEKGIKYQVSHQGPRET